MKAKLQRLETGPLGTFGQLTITDNHDDHVIRQWKTGELPDKGNERGVSCIPPGIYKCGLVNSPKFGPETYEVLNVPNRSHVLIHAGNHCGDTSCGHTSDVEGCILLGKEVLPVLNDKKVMQKGVAQSRVALAEFKKFLNGQDFELEIIGLPIAYDTVGS